MFALIERLVFLLFLVSVVRSALQFVFRIWRGSQAHTGPARTAAPPRPSPAGSTLLHQDPVCGTYVAADTSLKRIVNGKVIHFCSAECRDRYTG